MPSLRDEITKTFQRLSGRTKLETVAKRELDETMLATDAREGRNYGNYRVLRRLGAGGMGHVYLALDTHLGRHAALKFLSPKLKANPEMLARLQQEARTASSLNHPNILTIYDIDEAAGEPFLASEFIDGVTLRQALERGAVDPASALDIAIQIASALKPAHDAGVIHRDLKPSNVMLRPDGLVKVIDFGLAKFAAAGHIAPLYEALSDPGFIAGTVQYMSPEQARGDEVDHRTDLWSLGVMLYEMVSRHKPFDGETESHIIVAILDHRPAELKVASGVPAGLAPIIEKALAKSPDKRYQSAQEMLSALKTLHLSSQTTSKIRASRLHAAFAAKRRTRRWIWVFALLCISLALAVWWWPLHGRELVLGPVWFDPVDYTQITHSGDVQLVALSPDGNRIAYTTRNKGQNQLHFLNISTKKEWAWPPYSGDTLGITVSPDSSMVYITVHDQREWGRVYLAKVNSNDLTFVLDDVDGPVSFSPDGTEFAFHRRSEDKRSNRESVIVVKTGDIGEQRSVLSKQDTSVGSRIAWAANGSIAATTTKEDFTGDASRAVLLLSSDGRALASYSDPGLRSLSGPAWIDSDSDLIFAGVGRGGDGTKATIVELATRSRHFRLFPSPPLTPNSVTVARDFQTIAAVTSTRKSTLWVAGAQTLSAPERWTSDDSFDSLTWTSDDAIVHPSPRGGNVSLWETKGPGLLRALPQRYDCASLQPAVVPGKPMLVFSSNCEASANASNLWILNERDGSSTMLTDHSRSDRDPAVSPDGDTVLYDSWPNNFPALMRLSMRTKMKSPFTSLQARNSAISPDGQHVACQIRETYDGSWRVAILSMRDGIIEKDNLPLPAESDLALRWSPDGKGLDYVDSHDSSNIWRFLLDGSPARPLTHLEGEQINDFAWNRDGTRLAWVSSDIKQDVVIFKRGSK